MRSRMMQKKEEFYEEPYGRNGAIGEVIPWK